MTTQIKAESAIPETQWLTSMASGSRAPAGIPKSSRATAEDQGQKPSVLFLDDEERIVNALRALFRSRYQVFTATDGRHALELLQRQHIHLVVTDQRMPGMTGVEFLRHAKALSPKTIRVLLTGFSDLPAIIGSVNDGEVFRFVYKPWRNQEIQAVVADAVGVGLELQGAASEPDDREQGHATAARQPQQHLADARLVTAGGLPSKQRRGHGEAVLILHDQPHRREEIRSLVADAYLCRSARNVDECLSALGEGNIAVLIAGVGAGKEDHSILFKALKQEHPHILTIALADASDADNIVELINQAKIFRYVPIPYRPGQLRHFIESAMAQYQKHKANPVLLRQQRPDPKSAAAQSTAGALILDRIKSVRKLFLSGVAKR